MIAFQIGGYLWWKQWSPSQEFAILWIETPDGHDTDTWVLPDDLGDELSDWDRGEFRYGGETYRLTWLGDDETQAMRRALQIEDVPAHPRPPVNGFDRLPTMAYETEIQRIEAALRDEGWADQASVAAELRSWARLAEEANMYSASVDDYTNDLCSRDYLAEVAERASSSLRMAVDEQLSWIDESFRNATVEDSEGRLGRYYRVERKDGWWWRRVPSSGPLTDYLASSD